MKPLAPVMKDALESQQYRQALLISLEDIGGQDFYYTTWNTGIYQAPNMYVPRGMQFQNISYSSTQIVDRLSVDLDDVDRSLYGTLGKYNIREYPVEVTFVILDENSKVIASLGIFTGTIDQWSYSPGKVKIIAVSIFSQWTRVTTALYSGSCRWRKFKGTECQYSGTGMECDRTYDQCVTYSNEDNYGGFRWLPSLIGKRLKV